MSMWDNYKDVQKFALPVGAGSLGAGLGNLFSDYKNPADSAMPYMNQIPGVLKEYLNPYIARGNTAGNALEGQYGNLLNDPGGMVNKIGQGYQQSPGFKFALQQALQSAGHAQAAGGMAGSPQHEQTNMGLATNLANQDYGDWLQRALGLYGHGLQGEEGLYNTGAQTGVNLGQNLASILGNQANLAYEGKNAENQHQGGMWGSLLGGGASLAAALL